MAIETQTSKEENMGLATYLRKRSREICRDNQCSDDDHQCGSYAYITHDMQLLDICLPDYFQGSNSPVCAVPLPWSGNQAELEAYVNEEMEE